VKNISLDCLTNCCQAPNEKQHLRILLDELGPAPAQVPRKENRTLDLSLFSRWETPIQDITTALMAENNVTQNEILYMETKSIFVQLIRSIPHAADKRPINLPAIAEKAATSKDATLVRKGIKVKEMLRELEELKVVDRKDDFKLMQEEVAAELVHLGNLREKVLQETRSLEAVYKTICDHNNYLRSQLEQYKAYLQNVRFAADKGAAGGVGVLAFGGKERKPTKTAPQGPFRYTHAQLEKEGIIVESNVPDNRYVLSLQLHQTELSLTHLALADRIFTLTFRRRRRVPSSSPFTTKAGRKPFWRWTSR